MLEPHRESTDIDRPWVVATRGRLRSDSLDEDLDRVLRCFPRTVEVPQLRHHIEDMRELMPFMISKLTKGGSPDLFCVHSSMEPALRRVG